VIYGLSNNWQLWVTFKINYILQGFSNAFFSYAAFRKISSVACCAVPVVEPLYEYNQEDVRWPVIKHRIGGYLSDSESTPCEDIISAKNLSCTSCHASPHFWGLAPGVYCYWVSLCMTEELWNNCTVLIFHFCFPVTKSLAGCPKEKLWELLEEVFAVEMPFCHPTNSNHLC